MPDIRPIDLIDVLDRVLDKGIVIDAWVQVSVAGLELVTIEASSRPTREDEHAPREV